MMMKRKLFLKSKAVTLVELLLAMAISGTLLSSLTPYVNYIQKIWTLGDRETEMLQHARIALDRMTRQIRQNQIIDIGADYIEVTDREKTYDQIFFHNIKGSAYYIGNRGNIKTGDLVEKYIDQNQNTESYNLLARSVQSITFEQSSDLKSKIITINMEIADWENILQKRIIVSGSAYNRFIIGPPLPRGKAVININRKRLYDTITKAIEEARSGDTIAVSKGTYYENITINAKNIKLEGAYDASDWSRHLDEPEYETVIDGQKKAAVVSCYNLDSKAKIDGFTIKNGKGVGTGGGIYCNNASLAIKNNLITKNESDYGGGIGLYNKSNPTISNNTIIGNSAKNKGGGIYIQASSTNITDTTVAENNTSNRGAGISLDSYSSLNLANSTVTKNNISGLTTWEQLQTDKGTGAGISLEDHCSLEMDNTIVSNNSADLGAGGIYAKSYCSLAINKSTVTGNTVSRHHGGGIYLETSSSLTMADTSVNGNISPGSGGGIYAIFSCALNIANSTINENRTTFLRLSDGGGIALHSSTLTITKSTINGNRCEAYDGDGGGIALDYTSLVTIDETTISGNNCGAAGDGGGIYADHNSSLTINKSTVSGNTSLYYGGGIYAWSLNKLIITSSIISGNQTVIPSSARGGGINLNTANFRIANSIILANVTRGIGGGIYMSGSGEIVNCVLAKNTATDSGGGIYGSYAGGVIIRNSIIYKNGNYGIAGTRAPIRTRYATFFGNSGGQAINLDRYDSVNRRSGLVTNDPAKDFPGWGWDGTSCKVEDPKFVNPDQNDYHLDSGSPCKDTGEPGAAYNDRDGTPNDRGVYGGPNG